MEARRVMDYIMEHNPGLYQKWLSGKAVAKQYRDTGKITAEEYALFKAEWHKRRGFPDAHYRWKSADTSQVEAWPVDLQDALNDGLGRLSPDHAQIVSALHDADVLEVLDPRTLHSYFDMWEEGSIQQSISLLYANTAQKALDSLHTETAREIARQNLKMVHEFEQRYAEAVEQRDGREPPSEVAHRMLDHFLAQAWKRL